MAADVFMTWKQLQNQPSSVTGGKMNNAHCAVCCVHTLSAGASGSERVDAEILWINVDVHL